MKELVRILNRHTAEIVAAELFFDVPHSIVVHAQISWNRYRKAYLQHHARASMHPPAHSDWDWDYKFSTSDPMQVRFFAIHRSLTFEGLMMLASEPQASRQNSPDRKCVLYVEFLEAAPWNQPEYAGADARYKGIGIGLLCCAIECSMEAGCGGAIALHSLPAAESFYRRLHFNDFGFDVAEGYRYFELGAEAAAQFLKGERL